MTRNKLNMHVGKAFAEIGFPEKRESICITGGTTVDAPKKYHKLVHHLLQKMLNSSIPWDRTKPAMLATVLYAYSEAYILASL